MRASHETLKAFTERAVAATIDGTLIPPTVFIPAGLRKRRVRVREMHTLNPADAAENELRIAQADPVGFLIAVMQGQPIPSFEVRETKGKVIVETHYTIPDLNTRTDAARALRARNRIKNDDREYQAMIERAAAG